MTLDAKRLWGSAQAANVTDDFNLNPVHARVVRIKCTVTGKYAHLPQVSATLQGYRRVFLRPGNIHLVLINPGGSGAVVYGVKDSDGTILLNVAPGLTNGDMLKIRLVSNSTDAGTWDLTQSTVGEGVQPNKPYMACVNLDTELELYDHNLDTWSSGATPPHAFDEGTYAGTISGIGMFPEANALPGTVEKYSFDTWATAGTGRNKRTRFRYGKVVLGKLIYWGSDEGPGFDAEVDEYDGSTWAALNDATTGFVFSSTPGCSVTIGNENYTCRAGTNTKVLKYDRSGDSYIEEGADPPLGARQKGGGFQAASGDLSFYCVDGDSLSSGAPPFDDISKYDTVANVWAQKTQNGLGIRQDFISYGPLVGDYGFSCGGFDGNSFPALEYFETRIYDVDLDSWRAGIPNHTGSFREKSTFHCTEVPKV